MAGPENAEVAVVKGGQLRLVEPLDDCKDRGIHKPHVGVGIAVTQFADTSVIFGLQFLNMVGPSNDVIQKGEEDPGVKPGVHEPVYFGQDRRGDNQGLHSVLQKIEAAPVLGIGPVKGRVQRPGVED